MRVFLSLVHSTSKPIHLTLTSGDTVVSMKDSLNLCDSQSGGCSRSWGGTELYETFMDSSRGWLLVANTFGFSQLFHF